MLDLTHQGFSNLDLARALQVQVRESLMSQVEHIPQYGCHFYELARVGSWNLYGAGLNPQGHAHDQVTNTFEICRRDRKSTRLNSSHLGISYAVFCLKKKNMI